MNRSAPHTENHRTFDAFLATIPPEQHRRARAAMLGYVLGDVPPEVFAEAMEVLRMSAELKSKGKI